MLKKKKQSRRSHYTSEQIKKNQNKLFKSSTVSAGEQHNTSVRNKNLNTNGSTNKKNIKKVDKPKVMQTRIKVGKRLIKKNSVEGRKILKDLKIRKKAAK